jgi:hypothetical protein
MIVYAAADNRYGPQAHGESMYTVISRLSMAQFEDFIIKSDYRHDMGLPAWHELVNQRVKTWPHGTVTVANEPSPTSGSQGSQGSGGAVV